MAEESRMKRAMIFYPITVGRVDVVTVMISPLFLIAGQYGGNVKFVLDNHQPGEVPGNGFGGLVCVLFMVLLIGYSQQLGISAGIFDIVVLDQVVKLDCNIIHRRLVKPPACTEGSVNKILVLSGPCLTGQSRFFQDGSLFAYGTRQGLGRLFFGE